MSIPRLPGNFSVLPDEIALQCLQDLSPADLRAVSLACTTLRDLVETPSLWVDLCQRVFSLTPPNPISAKRMFQVHYDMKKGRFLVKSKRFEDGPVALIGKKFILKDHFYAQVDERKEPISLSCQPPIYHSTGIWNGAELASMGNPTRMSTVSLWAEKEKGCLVSRASSVGRGLATHSKNGVLCYQWYGKELLTLWGGADNHIFFQNWDVSQDPKLNFNVMLFYPGSLFVVEGENYEKFAWDGHYLAIKSPTGADIWQIGKGLLKKTGSITDSITSLKWKGKFLFAGHRTGLVTIS